MSPPTPTLFKTHDRVEVSSDEDGFRGAFFEAQVVRSMPNLRRYTVQYATLVEDADHSRPLRETVEASHVRPPPPRQNHLALALYDAVDAYHNEAWWVGVVVSAPLGLESKWVVCFPATREVFEFEREMVRPHVEWVDGRWVKPEIEENAETPFAVGTKVEVARFVNNAIVSWSSAIVAKLIWKDNYLVEYFKFIGGTELMREVVNLQHVRPCFPQDSVSHFDCFDDVEALHIDGWCPGVITKTNSNSSYLVKLENCFEDIEFSPTNLRHKYELVDGQWGQKSRMNRRVEFREGDLVEVRSDEEGFSGAWFIATIIRMTGNKYVVEYKDLKTDDEASLLRETVDPMHIRPTPPIVPVAKFRQLEEVNAWNNDGWWVGVISKVHKDKYTVYFRAWKEELEFRHEDLRLHQEWIGGKWWRPSQNLL